MKKPTALKAKLTGRTIAEINSKNDGYRIYKIFFSLDDAKRLFAWTGRALNYLEKKDLERKAK